VIQFGGSGRLKEDIASRAAKEAEKTVLALTEKDTVAELLFQKRINSLRKKNCPEAPGLTDFEVRVAEEINASEGLSKERIIKAISSVKAGRFLEVKADFPDFPTIFSRGQALLMTKTRVLVGRDFATEARDYLIQRYEREEEEKLEKDQRLFLSLGLSLEKADKAAALCFDLRGVASAPTINESLFKKAIAKAIQEEKPLDLVHIKSLRYTYPEGKRLVVLNHLDEELSAGFGDERRRYPGEKIILARLGRIMELFCSYGIKPRLTVLVADNDLEVLFPPSNRLVSPTEVLKARKMGEEYISEFAGKASLLTKDIFLLTDYLALLQISETYEKIRLKILEDIKGRRQLVKETVIEERVNHQFEHYREMFGARYTRSEARNTAYGQIANLLMLSVVFESFPGLPVVIIDDRGRENRLIGGFNPGSSAIFLTKVKDPTVIVK
jgi:hypothetical protein